MKLLLIPAVALLCGLLAGCPADGDDTTIVEDGTPDSTTIIENNDPPADLDVDVTTE